ncbi:hypothetical protein NEOC95_001871 [Neochlamydia sp. AcF95]|nr:hypothetical protein [Neochlamydia sp. AcF95]
MLYRSNRKLTHCIECLFLLLKEALDAIAKGGKDDSFSNCLLKVRQL